MANLDPTSNFPKDWTLTIGGVQCGIFQADDDAIVESNQETGRAATVRFICNWNDRIGLIAGLLGTVDYNDSETTISRNSPFSYPVAGGDQDLIYPNRTICTSISSV